MWPRSSWRWWWEARTPEQRAHDNDDERHVHLNKELMTNDGEEHVFLNGELLTMMVRWTYTWTGSSWQWWWGDVHLINELVTWMVRGTYTWTGSSWKWRWVQLIKSSGQSWWVSLHQAICFFKTIIYIMHNAHWTAYMVQDDLYTA